MPHVATVPAESRLHADLADAYFYDAYTIAFDKPDASVLDIYLKGRKYGAALSSQLPTTE